MGFWPNFVQNRSGRMASEDKPAAEMSGKSSDGNDRTEDAILSPSSSWSLTSSSASSSCLSSASSSSFREPEPKPQPELRRKRASPRSKSKNPLPPPPARYYGSATGIFLLLLSLLVMVFCGRLYAILWTSSLLCLVPRRKSDAGLAVENPTAVGPPGRCGSTSSAHVVNNTLGVRPRHERFSPATGSRPAESRRQHRRETRRVQQGRETKCPDPPSGVRDRSARRAT